MLTKKTPFFACFSEFSHSNVQHESPDNGQVLNASVNRQSTSVHRFHVCFLFVLQKFFQRSEPVQYMYSFLFCKSSILKMTAKNSIHVMLN